MRGWQRIRVRRPDEETGCERCGGPVYVGESYYMSLRNESVACGTGCARWIDTLDERDDPCRVCGPDPITDRPCIACNR